MKRALVAIVIVGAMVMSSGSISAMQRGKGGGSKPKSPAAATQGPKVKSQGAPKGPKAAAGPKAKSPSSTKTPGGAKTTAAAKGSGKGKTASGTASTTTTSEPAKKGKKTSTTTTSGTADAGSGTPTETLTPVQQKLQRNTKLASKLESRLPAGTDIMTAASGFKNLGQFVAAVNVSNNLGIPFMELKTRMVDDGMSLGRAIQDARPSADAVTEVRRAERDATVLIEQNDADATASATKPKAKADAKPKARARKSGGGL